MTFEGTEILSKKDLEDVLSTSIGGFGVWNEDTSGTSVQVESFKVTSLVKPGDNYASNIMAVDMTLAENHRRLSLIAKLVPQSEALKHMLESSTIFKKEISFYSLILPRLDEIQREKRLPTRELVDIFPTYYGSRSPGDDGGVRWQLCFAHRESETSWIQDGQ
uniref:Uncharacterized protein n=1 Tax=Timema tahoe TaxID=61484 RepID=A0A7R9IKS6_9NEOP|nr:unnamed protein product [Timema tahoe]